MRYRYHAALLAGTAASVAAAPAAPGANGNITLQRRLDSPFSLRLRKTPLSKVFADIGRRANISIEVENSVYAALPYGATTRISATFRNASLRTAIDKILSPLGLRDATSGKHLIVMPSPALARIGRRATWEELQLLQSLRRAQLTSFTGNWTADLRKTLGRGELTVQIKSDDAAAAQVADAKVRAELPTSVAQALDTYAAATRQIWFVRKNSIHIMSRHYWLLRQLRRPIVVHFSNAPLETVVTRLGQLSGIRFKPDPGLYLAIPAVSLDSSNATVQQTLDVLSGAARIAYTVKRSYVLLHLAGKSGATRRPRDPIVGTLRLPMRPGMGTFDVFVRRSDLPGGLYHRLQDRLRKAVRALHGQLQNVPIIPPPALHHAPPAARTRPASTRPEAVMGHK